MGFCFEVASLVHDPQNPALLHNPPAKAEWLQNRWEVIRLICQHFEWQEVPWQEPSRRRGREADCAGWEQYDWLRQLVSDNRTPSSIISSHAFPHLSDRNDSRYAAIYIPIPFEQPFQIHTSFYWGVCTVGSSVCLRDELQILQELLPHCRERELTKAIMKTAEEWQALEDFRRILHTYAQESVDLLLPLQMTW